MLRQGQAPQEPVRASEERILYGDSTPFPYGIDFLSAIRAVVDTCVVLLQAQATIDHTVKHSSELEHELQAERWRLATLLEQVRVATQPSLLASARARMATQQLLAGARTVCDRASEDLDRQWAAELEGTARICDEACTSGYQALETLLIEHVPPESSVSWRLAADDEGYNGQMRLETRFGLAASFGLAIPRQHAWAQSLRVGDLAPGTHARLPRPQDKRGRDALHDAALDKLMVAEALLEPQRIALVLRRGVRTGAGFRIEVLSENGQTSAQPLDEHARACGDLVDLDDGGREALLPLVSAVLDSTFDLALRRSLMTAATLEGRSLRERHDPRDVCNRLIGAYAPIVSEIARRSSPQTELVLRRDLGGSRREAMFLRRGELRDRIAQLPVSYHEAFTPLGLG